MAISHGGRVEFAFPFLDPNISSVYGITTNVLPDFSSEVETRRAPWLAPLSSSVASIHKLCPDLDSQLHSVKRDSTNCLLPMFAASDSSYIPINDCHINPLFMPIGNQGNRLRASAVPQNYLEMLHFRDRGAKPSFPHVHSGGAPSLINGKHGDIMTKMTPQEIMNAKALAASKSHSEAERRRRERINTHLATLRSLLPNTTKTDKASLLAEVIHHVKELKRKATDIAESTPIPSDTDELRVDTIFSEGAEDGVLMKVSLCCDDYPTLLSDLTKALRNLKLQMVKSEIVTLGGRMKNVILLSKQDKTSREPDESLLENVREALREMLERSVSNQFSPAVHGSISKRQKLCFKDLNEVKFTGFCV